jgi:hypothetical protein
MIKSQIFIFFAFSSILLLCSSESYAGWPATQRVYADVAWHWEKTWPEQKFTHLKKKTECQYQHIEIKSKTGKVRKKKVCLIKTDVFIEKGYRYLIYRDTFVYYHRKKLHSVQLGELEKAWKAGGVPPPTTKQANQLLQQWAAVKYKDSKVEISVLEIGKPRQYKDTYRVSLVLDLTIVRKKKTEKQSQVFVSLQSEGQEWKPIQELAN